MNSQGAPHGLSRTQRSSLTLDDLRGLPPVIPVAVADGLLGIGATLAKKLRKAGTYPVPLLGLGRKGQVRTADLLRYLLQDAAK